MIRLKKIYLLIKHSFQISSILTLTMFPEESVRKRCHKCTMKMSIRRLVIAPLHCSPMQPERYVIMMIIPSWACTANPKDIFASRQLIYCLVVSGLGSGLNDSASDITG